MLSKILPFLVAFALFFMYEIPSQAFIDYGKQTLIGDDFSSQDLRGATCYLTDLQDANLSGSDLEGASLFGAKLLNTDLAKKYGWKSKVNLDEGFDLTLKNFLTKRYKK